MNIQSVCKKVLRFVTTLKRKASGCIKSSPTILCCDCVAGVMYHDLALPFRSPTINLYMQAEDFLRFVQQLPQYKNADIIKKTDSDKPFPVGVLRYGDLEDIELFFMHYTTFEEAVEKWKTRCNRIDFDEVVVVLPLLSEGERTELLLDDFQKIPYKKVALVTDEYAGHLNTFAYSKAMFDPNGADNLLSYRKNNKLLQWRYLDYFDYNGFLKNGEINARRI